MADQARLQAVLETAVDGIITIDERGLMEAANPAAERLFGYSAADLLGRNVNMLMPSPHQEQHDQYLKNYQATGERKIIGIGREVCGRRKDGSTFPLYLAVSEVSHEGRRIFTGFLHDLSDLRAAEERSTNLGRILEESLNEVLIFDAATLQFLFANRGALQNTGYTLEQILRLTPLDLISPTIARQTFHDKVRPLLTGELSLLHFETIHQRSDKSRYNISVRIQQAIWEGRNALVAIILDVTEQIRVQQELHRREGQVKFMVDHLPAAAAYVDYIGREVRFNKKIEAITGYKAEELTNLDDVLRILFGENSDARAQYEAARLQWKDSPVRMSVSTAAGEERIVEFRGYGYDDHEVWLIDDVTDRDRFETELRIRDRAIQAANEGMVIADATREGNPIIFVNEAFEALSGYKASEVIGGGCEVLCGDEADAETLMDMKAAIVGHREYRSTIPCRRKNGGRFWNEISIAPVRSEIGVVTHIVAVMEDVSERRSAQQQLLQSERLAAIGQMVTGLAHESRNALQRAQACLDMLSLDLEGQPEQLELTDKTRRALMDLHRYYEEVRNYAAPINLQRRPTDLVRLLESTWRNVESTQGKNTFQLDIEPTSESAICNVDEHRIEQVFRNIIENAMAACGQSGQLKIAYSGTKIAVAGEAGRDGLKIAFRDTGPGISPEAATSIFQPFFTTKQKGTGLGMAISKRIVEAHGGIIRIGESSVGAEIIVELMK